MVAAKKRNTVNKTVHRDEKISAGIGRLQISYIVGGRKKKGEIGICNYRKKRYGEKRKKKHNSPKTSGKT